jgi:tetratricopeptide (TPR) repeat protein
MKHAAHGTPLPLIALVFLLTIGVCGAYGASDGWRLLVDNKPLEALEAFERQAAADDPATVGSACRGLAAVHRFLGEEGTAMDYTFRAFLADGDTVMLNAGWIHTIGFSRGWAGHLCTSGYRAHEALLKEPSLLSGEHMASMAHRLANDGKLDAANAIIERMGVVRTFRMIGPFENISESGYDKPYPPEQTIRFDTTYAGKDGGRTEWFAFHNRSPLGWVFTRRNFPVENAVLYYYTNVQSDRDRQAYLGFGASGAFTVLLNRTVVLADSVFRNTGADVFIQKVKLFKGDNLLLVKLAHETRPSNFMIRLMNARGERIEGVTYTDRPGTFRHDTTTYADKTRSPMTRRVTTYLRSRLERDEDDLEAALLLMDYCNGTELTDQGQRLARRYLARYPRSSLWHGLYSESLVRSRKITEGQTAIRAAYKLCPLNASAWANELSTVSRTASPREILSFIEQSPERLRTGQTALLAAMNAHARDENESEVMSIMARLDELHGDSPAVMKLMAAYYAGQGSVRKAEKLLKRLVRWEHTTGTYYSDLAGLYLKMGNRRKAFKVFDRSLRYMPNASGFHSYLAKLAFKAGDHALAMEHIDKALSLTPTAGELLNLKGAVLAATERTDEAVEAFRRAIAYRYDNFLAWDQLLPLRGKPTLTSLAPLPDPDTLLAQAGFWNDLDGDNGSIVASMKDVFLYPSRCSRERYYLVVHLPTQGAIDSWKEYRLSYNPHYQVAHITRAFSKSASGKETPADVEQGMVVFKTLQPGDHIVLEWTLENHYRGDMARHVWGERSFDLPYPVFKSQLRFVTPLDDTIPYDVQGDSIRVSADTIEGFKVTALRRDPYKNPGSESYMLIDPPSSNRVAFSTLPGWGAVTSWYRNLTENKVEQTAEIRALVDSLCKGAATPLEKLTRIHRYITGTIRYSFVPFRQSAWIPQPAREVLATRIGDCKDMSSLGKCLLDCAGIPGSLVLVNTRDRNSIYPSYVGPNFNHCILSCTIDGSRRFVDMTDANLSVENLPRMDQGAVALVIDEGVDSLIHLPVDQSDERSIVRAVKTVVDEQGRLTRRVETVKAGLFAGRMRGGYRFQAPAEQEKRLRTALVDDWPDVAIDTLRLGNLDTLSDTVRYEYGYSVTNGVSLTGNTAIVPLNIPDRLTGEHFPNEEQRHYPIDMNHTWFGVGSFTTTGTMEVPKGWRLINRPQPVELNSEHGSYRLEITMDTTAVRFRRVARFDYDRPVTVDDYPPMRTFLSQVAKADNVQLIFTME